MEGRYVPSLLSAIGEVIERHKIDIGFLPDPKRAMEELPAEARLKVAQLAPPAAGSGRVDQRLRQCPKCGAAGLIRQEGCDLCTSCGYSRCG
jgi:ribonucleoside-diphosphate reductase alpha chain